MDAMNANSNERRERPRKECAREQARLAEARETRQAAGAKGPAPSQIE